MRKHYQPPEMELDEILDEDIVCTSLNNNEEGYPGENGGQL